MAIGPGVRIGPYEIVGLLGEGGMGQVYRATDTSLKRTVAINRTLIPDGTNPRYVSTGHIVYGSEGTLRAVAFDVSRLAVMGNPIPVVDGVMVKPSGAANFSVSSTGTLAYAAGNAVADVKRSMVWMDRQGREEPVPLEPRNYQEFSLSPDGTRVAARVLNVDGENDIWIHDLTRNISTRLTFDPGVELFPTWTPDGSRVAFGSLTSRLSWKAADGTGAVDAIGEVGELPHAFSPDGAALVFESREAGNDIGIRWLRGDRPSRLVLEGSFAMRNPSLSRDGRWLAYESSESGTLEIFVRPFPDLNAGRWQISHSGGQWPVWSPASDELIYRSREGVTVQAFDNEPTFTLRSRSPLFTLPAPSLDNANRRLAVSRDGKRILLLKDLEDASVIGASRRIVVIENWTERLKRLVPTN